MMTKWMEDWKSVVHKHPHYEKKIYMVTNKKNPHQSLNFIDSDDRMKEQRVEDIQELIINFCQGAVIEIQSRVTRSPVDFFKTADVSQNSRAVQFCWRRRATRVETFLSFFVQKQPGSQPATTIIVECPKEAADFGFLVFSGNFLVTSTGQEPKKDQSIAEQYQAPVHLAVLALIHNQQGSTKTVSLCPHSPRARWGQHPSPLSSFSRLRALFWACTACPASPPSAHRRRRSCRGIYSGNLVSVQWLQKEHLSIQELRSRAGRLLQGPGLPSTLAIWPISPDLLPSILPLLLSWHTLASVLA